MSISLEAVKPGDFVATQRMGKIVKSKVDRVTKTQIIVGDKRFDKRYGKQVGCSWGSYLQVWSSDLDDALAEQEANRKKDKLITTIRSVGLHRLSVDQLEKISALLEEIIASDSSDEA